MSRGKVHEKKDGKPSAIAVT